MLEEGSSATWGLDWIIVEGGVIMAGTVRNVVLPYSLQRFPPVASSIR